MSDAIALMAGLSGALVPKYIRLVHKLKTYALSTDPNLDPIKRSVLNQASLQVEATPDSDWSNSDVARQTRPWTTSTCSQVGCPGPFRGKDNNSP